MIKMASIPMLVLKEHTPDGISCPVCNREIGKPHIEEEHKYFVKRMMKRQRIKRHQ